MTLEGKYYVALFSLYYFFFFNKCIYVDNLCFRILQHV